MASHVVQLPESALSSEDKTLFINNVEPMPASSMDETYGIFQWYWMGVVRYLKSKQYFNLGRNNHVDPPPPQNGHPTDVGHSSILPLREYSIRELYQRKVDSPPHTKVDMMLFQSSHVAAWMMREGDFLVVNARSPLYDQVRLMGSWIVEGLGSSGGRPYHPCTKIGEGTMVLIHDPALSLVSMGWEVPVTYGVIKPPFANIIGYIIARVEVVFSSKRLSLRHGETHDICIAIPCALFRYPYLIPPFSPYDIYGIRHHRSRTSPAIPLPERIWNQSKDWEHPEKGDIERWLWKKRVARFGFEADGLDD